MALTFPLTAPEFADKLRIQSVRWWLQEHQEASLTGGGDFLVADLAPRLWRGDVTLIQLDCVSHSRMLTRTNPAKKSHEAQKLRSGDKFRQYNTVAGQWQYWWGEREGETMG